MKRVIWAIVAFMLLQWTALGEERVFVRLDGRWLDPAEYDVSSTDSGCELRWQGRSAEFPADSGVYVFDILSYDIMKVRLTRMDSESSPPVLETAELDWTGEIFGYMESYEPELQPFSYAETCEKWPEGEPGVIIDGFVNTDVSPVCDMESAVMRAANECSSDYDMSAVFYDDETGVWNVLFMRLMYLGGSRNVYMNSDGITLRIIDGE